MTMNPLKLIINLKDVKLKSNCCNKLPEEESEEHTQKKEEEKKNNDKNKKNVTKK